MTPERINELAMEVVSESMSMLEEENQSYFYGVVKIISDTIINDYALDSLGSESYVKELMNIDLKELRKRLGQ